MNRKEALDWCVDNLIGWPTVDTYQYRPKGWSYGLVMADINMGHATELPITKQDWLDAKASKDKNMIDWDNAPEGATHYFKGGACHHSHWCNSKGELFVEKYPEDGWQKDTGFKYPLKDIEYVERPTEQPYMPQVGEFFDIVNDVSLSYGAGESGECIGHIEDCAIIRMSYGLGCFSPKNLSPIKTEREKNIEGMKSIIDAWHRNGNNGTLLLASLLNEAGYKSDAPTT